MKTVNDEHRKRFGINFQEYKMKKVSKSYLALKHDVVTMGLPYPFFQDFSVVHKTLGVGTVTMLLYDEKMVLVRFGDAPTHIFDVNELFDLDGDWVVDFGKLSRRSALFKASYESRRNDLIDSIAKLMKRERQWDFWYGRKSTLLLKEEAKARRLKKIVDHSKKIALM